MTSKRFKLVAKVSSSNPISIRTVLEELVKKGSVKKAEDANGGFIIEAEMEGSHAKELNRCSYLH